MKLLFCWFYKIYGMIWWKSTSTNITGQRKGKNNEADGNNENKEDSNEINAMKEMDHGKVITGWWTNAWHGSRRYRGWSLEGLNQFNKLVAMVQQDREMDMHFQVQYKIWLKESIANKTKKKQRKNNEPVVTAYWDLSSLGV